MAFIKHVGKHGDRKVAIVFREVPGEPHMALVVYTEILNRSIHDPLIKCIESEIGQTAEDLATALNRSYTTDGQIILQKLHAEGMLKKVQTELIVMTPAPNTKIKLSELNKVLDEMQKGDAAVKKLQEMDSQRGMQDPMSVARKMREGRDAIVAERNAPVGVAGSSDVLGDTSLANNLRQQAAKMSAEAKGLLVEAERLSQQAEELAPTKKVTKVTIPVNEATAGKKRGRKPKVVPIA